MSCRVSSPHAVHLPLLEKQDKVLPTSVPPGIVKDVYLEGVSENFCVCALSAVCTLQDTVVGHSILMFSLFVLHAQCRGATNGRPHNVTDRCTDNDTNDALSVRIIAAKSTLRLVENKPVVHCHLRSVCRRTSSHQCPQCWECKAFQSIGHLCLNGNHCIMTEAKNCKRIIWAAARVIWEAAQLGSHSYRAKFSCTGRSRDDDKVSRLSRI